MRKGKETLPWAWNSSSDTTTLSRSFRIFFRRSLLSLLIKRFETWNFKDSRRLKTKWKKFIFYVFFYNFFFWIVSQKIVGNLSPAFHFNSSIFFIFADQFLVSFSLSSRMQMIFVEKWWFWIFSISLLSLQTTFQP